MLYIGFKLRLQENLKSCHDCKHRDTIGLVERLVLEMENRDTIWEIVTRFNNFSPSLPERDWSQRLFRDNRGAIGQNRGTILDCCD